MGATIATQYTVENAPQTKYTVEDDTPIAPVVKDWRDPLTELKPFDPSSVMSTLNTTVGNVGAGALGVVLRPVETAKGVGKFLAHPLSSAAQFSRQFFDENGNPAPHALENAEGFLGQMATFGAAGEAVPKLAKVPGRVAEAVTKTGPSETANLVKETQAENAGIRKTNAEEAQAHLDKTIDALHQTHGNELQYQQALKIANDAADEAQRALDVEHSEAVQKALQETREKEDLYHQELRKAKTESEAAYQEKLADVEKKRAKAEQARKQEVHRYLLKKGKIQSDFAEAQEKFKTESAKQGKIPPTNTKLQTAWSNLRAGVETARERGLAIGNEKYSGVNLALSHIQSDPEFFPGAVANATEALRGSKSEPTLLKSMETSIKSGDVATYADLQGDYSALGKEISKGNLPGDVFHAYDQLHEAIGDEMQRIADSKGQGAALLDARNYWRRMKQTFGKPFNPPDTATSATEKAAPGIASADEQANRIRLLGSFDPRLPGLFEHIQNLQKGAESLPKPVPEQTRLKGLVEARKPLPDRPGPAEKIPSPTPISPREVQPPARVEIPSRPGQVLPKMPKLPERVAPPDRPTEEPTKTIGPEEIQGAKEKSLRKKEERLRTGYSPLLTAISVFDAFRNAIHGNWEAVGVDIAARGLYEVGKQGFAALLRNEKVIQMLTKPTAADIAQIPADLRGPGLSRILQEANKQGIKVDPRWYAAAGAVQPKRPGDILPKVQ